MKFLNTPEVLSLFQNKKIAIVGSSPILNNTTHGSFIDEHDVVIRFNDSILFNIESPKNYGTKTDIWAISGWSPFLDREYPDKYFLQDFPKGHDNKGGSHGFLSFIRKNNPYILGTRPLNKPQNPQMVDKGLYMRGPIYDLIQNFSLSYIDTPQEIFELELLNGYFNLSSGLSTLLLSIHFEPKEINLFGFSFFDYNTPTHYWDNVYSYTKEMKEKNIGHNGDIEKNIISSVSSNFNVNLIQ